ncbi:ERAP1-like C-terminal domain-containing protein [Alloacidobacterium dinghuense]|uniref:Aminopeptidase N n=1 Tax=Alloacidobacterium dinghuense TaxID=2763107 RepID=A0A7G8BL86_9BACT|nr:M1 family aminopeptidase [Alloacidobacterium dinghuense]QNI33306.1 ERAP1-like C-terminal domain-containing protein [Alloacidobacterium dinghuense]
MRVWQRLWRRAWRLGVIGVTIGLSVSSASAFAEPAKAKVDSGITRALAVERAGRVSDLHYALRFKLRAHAESMHGEEVLLFTLRSGAGQADLPLDYRDGTISSATLNGVALEPLLTNGHLILPAQLLHVGENKLGVSFTSRVATAGAAITRYDDKDDGSEYLYSLFVPMDASMAFPCFDQPDMKARFSLALDAPSEWKVIGNTAPESTERNGTSTVTRFAETKPISTYLFAFAAGPWVNVHPIAGMPDVYVRRSQLKRAEPEAPQLQEITTRGMKWLADYFQQPFPFPKYDIVLIPGFPFGGMEHAGETFLREDSVLFRTAPTESDRFQRNILTLHELTHQWFGDLVTMRWFDDLWLKEGFAQYMAYRSLDSLEPKAQAWKHFYEDIKPQAYGIDETEGTTPIFQNIPNLKDAKSAYGAIVYQKAPAILKQLEFQLGADAFRNGLRIYLKEHAYANAQWSDLIGAFQTASGQDVRTWADAWVLRRGMPEVNVNYRCDAQGKLTELRLTQKDALPDGYLWPISNEVWLGYGKSGRASVRHRVNWSTAEIVVPEVVGEECPDEVFANYGDQAYGRFLLDEKSQAFVRQTILAGALRTEDTDPLLRSQLWGALWDGVHVAQSPPRAYVELVLANLPQEQDETLARIQGGHATTAVQRYMSAQARSPLAMRMEAIVTHRMLSAQTTGLRIVSFRTLTAVTETDAGRATLKGLLAGKVSVPGVELRPLDRWNLVEKLILLNDPEAASFFAAESKRDQTGDGQKYAWAVQAAVPDSATKDRYFAQYTLAPTSAEAKPEDWLTQSLRPFNAWNQSDLTEPFLGRALDQLPKIKRDRKIFFLGAWLGAFLGGQVSPDADAVVRHWLSQPDIDPDLRLKVLENADELERTVRIRQRFPE